MVIAPIVFNTAREFGTDLLRALLLYVATVVVGLLLQAMLVYAPLLRVIARRSPTVFFRDCREVILYAFSTASSNATLPLSLNVAETKLKLSPRISRWAGITRRSRRRRCCN